jgi:hypothetical protein
MKKLLFFLLISVSAWGQTKPEPKTCNYIMLPADNRPQKIFQVSPTGYSKPVTIYFEIDFAMFNYLGGTVAQSQTYLRALFVRDSLIYRKDSILIAFGGSKIWTTQDAYGIQGSQPISEFGQAMVNNPPAHADLAVLLSHSYRTSGGIAFISGLCFSTWGGRVAVCDYLDGGITDSLYTWDVGVTTHEIGHLLGSLHTQDCVWIVNGQSDKAIDGCGHDAGYGGGCFVCPCVAGDYPPTNLPIVGKGSIMSYCHLNVGIDFRNGFLSQPREAMRTTIANATCLVWNDTIQTCSLSLPTTLSTTNVTNTTATLNWNSNPVDSFYVRYHKAGDVSDKFKVVPGNQTTAGLTGLIPGSNYQWKIRAFCNGIGTSYTASWSNFTTTSAPVPCGIPQNVTVSQITSTSAFVSFDNSVSAPFFIFWYQQGNTNKYLKVTSHSATITGLTTGVPARVRVRCDCQNAIYSNWLNFTPQ